MLSRNPAYRLFGLHPPYSLNGVSKGLSYDQKNKTSNVIIVKVFQPN